jgi:hypothetical protein
MKRLKRALMMRAQAETFAEESSFPRWDEAPAEKREHVESFDNFAPVRNAIRELAAEKGEWAGIPIPIDGERLVIEPSYPFAAALSGKEEAPPDGTKIRNVFYSTSWRCDIIVYEEEGKIKHAIAPAVHNLDQQLSTLGASFAWGIEQESRALHLLGTLVRHHTFKTYLLTGSFLERSERSRVTYMFRKLRPTVAMHEVNGKMRVLCSLCQHPIGYYAGSWAGAMCPTDDVIAHLMLMRGDEPMLWRRSNQHAAHRPEAGI